MEEVELCMSKAGEEFTASVQHSLNTLIPSAEEELEELEGTQQ